MCDMVLLKVEQRGDTLKLLQNVKCVSMYPV